MLASIKEKLFDGGGHTTIFRSLFFRFIFVPLVPLIFIIYFSYERQVEARVSAEQRMIIGAQTIKVVVDSWVKDNIRINQSFAKLQAFQELDIPAMERELRVLKSAYPTTISTRVDNEVGMAIARGDNKKLKNYSSRQYFKDIKRGMDVGQQIVFGKTQKKPILCFSVPIKNEDRFVGGIAQCSSLEDISSQVAKLKIGETGFAYLVNSENFLVASGDPELIKDVNSLTNMASDQFLQNSVKNQLVNIKVDDEHYSVYRISVGLGWSLIIRQDYEEAFAELNDILFISVLITALTVFICLLATFFISRYVSLPIQKAKDETDSILEATSDALFLIDADFTICAQRSEVADSMLNIEEGEDFTKFLYDHIPSNVASNAKMYLNLMLDDDKVEELMADLNPLQEIPFLSNREDSNEERYFSFSFKRVYDEERIVNIFVSVSDVSESVKLRKHLDAANEKRQEEITLLADIIAIPLEQTKSFLGIARKHFSEMNSVLEKRGATASDFKQKAHRIFQLTHSLKGNASAIGFDLFVNMCHEFESDLERIQAKLGSIRGNEFMPLVRQLEGMISRCETVDSLLQKLENFKGDYASEASSRQLQSEWRKIEHYIGAMSEKYDLPVESHFKGFKQKFPEKIVQFISDIAIQFIRNSFVHGLEAKEQRWESSKISDCQITMLLKPLIRNGRHQGYAFAYSDDGVGIDYHKLKEQAVSKGLITDKQALSISESELNQYLFDGLLSAKEDVDVDGGRGVGLSSVYSQVKSLNGFLKIKSVSGIGVRFTIVVPFSE